MPSSAANWMSSRSLLRDGRRRDAAALAVESLAIRQLAADPHARLDGGRADELDVEHDLSVVEQQRVARRHIARQVLVGDAYPGLRAALGIERGVERERRALVELHAPFAKALDADLGAAEVEQHADAARGALRRLAHQLQAPPAVGDRAVRGVEARDVDAGAQHLGQYLEVVSRRSDGGDDLGAPRHQLCPPACARCSSTVTAGSGWPSMNSRNAPPPVEM